MPFETPAGRENGYYGKYVYDSNAKQYVFHALGKEIILSKMTQTIESKQVTWTLSFQFGGQTNEVEIKRKDISDTKTLISGLAGVGADVAPKNVHVIIDTLRQQQETLEDAGAVHRTYGHLGWLKSNKLGINSSVCSIPKHLYRGNSLVGSNAVNASYSGSFFVTSAGSFDVWKQGVINEVLGHVPLETVLLAGLSAVVNGLIAPFTTNENPIFHINGLSGTGKTTGAELAVSAFGAPFQGSDDKKHSLLSSWGATANALLVRCGDNRGAVLAFNEIGKFAGSDMTQIVYDLSEGTDKERLKPDLTSKRSETFFTTFISTGEISLLDRCKSNAEGLSMRVMEITEPLTDNADHANRIKAFCHNNYGHAAKRLAKHIIDSGGLDYALGVYERNRIKIIDKFPDDHFRDRFVAKFPALILATAEMATTALGIYFDIDDILDYFVRWYTGANNKPAAGKSFDVIIEECRINRNRFYIDKENVPKGDVYGRIRYPNKKVGDNKYLVEEYAVRQSVVENILKKHGYENKRTYIKEWRENGVLDCDSDRPTRSRRIEPNGKSEDVYVFLVYSETPTDNANNGITVQPGGWKPLKRPSSTIISLLEDDEAAEGGDSSDYTA